MKRLIRRSPCALALAILLGVAFNAGAQPDRTEFSLFPGDSQTVKDVKVTWSGADAALGAEGVLRFEKTGVAPLEIAAPAGRLVEPSQQGDAPPQRRVVREDCVVHYGELAFRIEPSYQSEERRTVTRGNSPVVAFYRFYAAPMPAERRFTAIGAPSTEAWLSASTPLRLNEWTLSVGAEPVTYEDGSSYHQIVAEREGGAERVSIPMTEGGQRNFGRFNVRFRYFYEPSKTAIVRVQAEPDHAIRGRGAFVGEEDQRQLPETVGGLLARLGEIAGFEIEWAAWRGVAESVDFVREMQSLGGFNQRDSTAGELVDEFIERHNGVMYGSGSRNIAHEWLSPTRLRVAAANYDLHLEAVEREAAREAAREAELERMRERFAELTRLETRSYTLQRLSASTAKKLVDPELTRYFLAPASITSSAQAASRRIEAGEHYRIISGREIRNRSERADASTPRPSVREEAFAEETALADERTHVLLVTATAASHDRVRAVLEKVDGLLAGEASGAAPKRYRVEAALLLGGKAGEAKAMGSAEAQAAAQNFDAALAAQYGISRADMELFGIDGVALLNRAIVSLLAERGEMGRAVVSLTPDYRCELEFQDVREPYLLARGRLLGASGSALIENTLYLERDKPTLLGLTNMRGEALILVFRLHDAPND